MSDATKAELAYERAEADYRNGVRAAAGIIALIMGLCVLASLSGCLTPAKLASMSQRADVLSKGAQTQACAEAAARAAEAVVAALEAMSAPAAMKSAEIACLECVKDKDCAEDQECVSGHCQKRRK